MNDLLDTAPCGFVSFADDGRILLVNTTLAGWLGSTPDQVQDRRVETLLSVGSRMFYQTHVFPLFKMSGRLEEIYLVLRSESGEDVPVLVNGVRRQRAETVVNDCVLVPMRQRDRYEDALRQAKKEAERATAALAVANEKLQQLGHFKDELMALTSHDLRGLVTTIRLSGQMLLDPKRAARIDAKHYLGNIVQATDRLLILLDDLSDLTVINTGGLRLQMRPVLLSAVARAVVQELAVGAEAKSIAVAVTVADQEPLVQGDYERLYQVVRNLLGNAIKFTPLGGTIALEVGVEADSVALRVRDSGIGIPPTWLPELFNHFTHPSRPGTAGERGSGLGLAIVHRLVALQGGTIVVESEEGQGSTFIIRLPVVQDQPDQGAPPPATADGQQSRSPWGLTETYTVQQAAALTGLSEHTLTTGKGVTNMSLFFEHAEDLPAQPGSADSFTGTVHVRSVAEGQGEPVRVGRVTFERGGRTHWHTHTGEQTLYFLEGQGRVQGRGEGAVDAAPGDVVRIPAGREHWHGTHPDEPHAMTHLAITFGAVTWLEPVSDEDYYG